MRTLAKSFEAGAAEYDRLRPTYPEPMWTDLCELAGERIRGRALDVGAGTGRATLPLLALGAHVDVVEPSADMLSVLGARLAAAGLDGRVTLRQATFEDVDPAERFDVVVAAQSFHWADPETRWQRLASILGRDGLAFLMWNGWVLDGERHDVDAVGAVYEAHGDGLEPDLRTNRSDSLWAVDEITACDIVRIVDHRRYAWPWSMSTTDYLALLATTSSYAVAGEDRRAAMFAPLAAALGPQTHLLGATQMLAVAAR